ncbi:hypothetical protein NLI96_g7280 [Meripilus lineatus]|uniref:Uncharacterized protein n=1 Tax=Meripilus lineatus TaxID=2056292 RepID=A0AAD5UZR7_9APHY|nr:hypothetical protein NLI96_g7280 [Physisporinus lineatus]
MSQPRLTFYTATDQARKKLKAPAQILLTLTPEDRSFCPNSYPPIAWKILSFQHNLDAHITVSWGNDYGFTIIQQQEDGIVLKGDLSVTVKPRHLAILKEENGIKMWTEASEQRRLSHDALRVSAYNKTGIPQNLALCTVDNTDSDEPKYLPVVHTGILKHQQTIESGPPVLLQAYAVAGYQVGQVLKTDDLRRALFRDPAGDEDPIDIRSFQSGRSFRVYSNHAGKVVIDRD